MEFVHVPNEATVLGVRPPSKITAAGICALSKAAASEAVVSAIHAPNEAARGARGPW